MQLGAGGEVFDCETSKRATGAQLIASDSD
jgi:hypothetical protein